MDRVPAVPPVERDDVVGGSKSGAMSRRSIVRAIGLATAATLLTAGCAAGQVAQTQYEKASIDGIDTSVGKVDLRGLAVEAPTSGTNFYKPGTAAQLRVVFLNNSTAADTLVSITGKGIGGWSVYSSYAQAAQVQNALGAPPAAPTRSLSPVASGTGSGTQAVGSSAPGSPTSPAGSSSPAAATSSSSSSPASATASAPSAPDPVEFGAVECVAAQGNAVGDAAHRRAGVFRHARGRRRAAAHPDHRADPLGHGPAADLHVPQRGHPDDPGARPARHLRPGLGQRRELGRLTRSRPVRAELSLPRATVAP